jgi:hypothetical protein
MTAKKLEKTPRTKPPVTYVRTWQRFVLAYGGPADYEAHSGHIVFVERRVIKNAEPNSAIYLVRAEDGWTGEAYAEELIEKIGTVKKTGPGCKPSSETICGVEFTRITPRKFEVCDANGVHHGMLNCMIRTRYGNTVVTWEGTIAGQWICEDNMIEAKTLAAEIVNNLDRISSIIPAAASQAAASLAVS